MRRKEELIYKLGLPVNFGDYPSWNTSACCPEARELSISGSENFASFRVFSGPQNIPARLAPAVRQ